MKYKTTFTVIFSKKTGRIVREIWEPLQRLSWPFPWKKLPEKPTFESYDDLLDWFVETHPGKKLKYDFYGKSRSED